MEVENKSETGAHGVFQHLNFIPNRLFNRIQRAPIEPKKYVRNGSTEVLDNSTKNIKKKLYIQGEQISRERSTLFCDLPQNVLVTTCRTNNRFTVCLHFLFYWIRNNKFLYHQRAPIAPSV